jgi:hypothetical protein
MIRSKFVLALFLVAIMRCTGLTVQFSNKKSTKSIECFTKSHLVGLRESSQTVGGPVDNKLKMKTGWVSLLLTASLAFGAPAMAAAIGGATSVFTNDYNDPLHPLCERHVKVLSDGKAFHFSGTQGKPGCTQGEIKEFGISKKEFDGFVEGTKISAGDGIHEGVWEPANSATTNLGYENVDGVRWNDGNKWTVKL